MFLDSPSDPIAWNEHNMMETLSLIDAILLIWALNVITGVAVGGRWLLLKYQQAYLASREAPSITAPARHRAPGTASSARSTPNTARPTATAQRSDSNSRQRADAMARAVCLDHQRIRAAPHKEMTAPSKELEDPRLHRVRQRLRDASPATLHLVTLMLKDLEKRPRTPRTRNLHTRTQ